MLRLLLQSQGVISSKGNLRITEKNANWTRKKARKMKARQDEIKAGQEQQKTDVTSYTIQD